MNAELWPTSCFHSSIFFPNHLDVNVIPYNGTRIIIVHSAISTLQNRHMTVLSPNRAPRIDRSRVPSRHQIFGRTVQCRLIRLTRHSDGSSHFCRSCVPARATRWRRSATVRSCRSPWTPSWTVVPAKAPLFVSCYAEPAFEISV
jgi:hypothetical protein